MRGCKASHQRAVFALAVTAPDVDIGGLDRVTQRAVVVLQPQQRIRDDVVITFIDHLSGKFHGVVNVDTAAPDCGFVERRHTQAAVTDRNLMQ